MQLTDDAVTTLIRHWASTLEPPAALAVTVAVPTDTAVTLPSASTVATDGSSTIQTTVLSVDVSG